MDEKGDAAMAMEDEEPENEPGEQPEERRPEVEPDIKSVADAPMKPAASWKMSERIAEHKEERLLADSPKGRISIKEKLAEMKVKASGQRTPDKPDISKGKEKQEML